MKSKDAKKPLISRIVKETVEHVPEMSKVIKSNPSSREDVEKQDKIRKKKKDLYDQFENGDIPRSPQDPTWKDYMEWARKYPKKMTRLNFFL